MGSLDQPLQILRLADECVGAGLDRARAEDRFLLTGEHEKLRVAVQLSYAFDDVKTVQSRQIEIKDHQLRLKLADDRQCRRAVTRLADDFELTGGLQSGSNGQSNGRVVIHDDY
jgi:hypothetical protein